MSVSNCESPCRQRSLTFYKVWCSLNKYHPHRNKGGQTSALVARLNLIQMTHIASLALSVVKNCNSRPHILNQLTHNSCMFWLSPVLTEFRSKEQHLQMGWFVRRHITEVANKKATEKMYSSYLLMSMMINWLHVFSLPIESFTFTQGMNLRCCGVVCQHRAMKWESQRSQVKIKCVKI